MPPDTPCRRDFYERLDWSSQDRPEVEWHIRQLSRLRTSDRRVRVLDIGCGDGRLAERSLSPGDGVTAVGVDVSIAALRRARSRGLAVAQGEVDGRTLPFAPGSVDAVLLSQVIEHVVDTDGLVAEAARVLRPGGLLLLSTPNLAAWFNRGLLLVGIQPVFSEVSLRAVYGRPGEYVAGHLRLFTARALKPFLEASGFVDVEISGATYHDVPTALRWLDRLSAKWPAVAAQLFAAAKLPSA